MIAVLGILLFFNFLSFELFLQYWRIGKVLYKMVTSCCRKKQEDAEGENKDGFVAQLAVLIDLLRTASGTTSTTKVPPNTHPPRTRKPLTLFLPSKKNRERDRRSPGPRCP